MKFVIRWLVGAFVIASVVWAGMVAAADGKIKVLNPRGIMPAIKQIPMAERPDTLDGKTIYIVDTKFANTKPFVNALRDNLAAAYPKTNWVGVDKVGGYMQDDPNLWAEIKAKGHGAIVLLGH
ncbi:MAG: hypothetical protein EPO31_10925 [Gammaproteobacteria bacterium]|jgi:hypothetical protein|nr:MAG: hypothetical protein EPO31_10925 [Gammaproteobacteria bacterium]